ncbi:predicted nucleic acid-binding protein [Jatrophihabitans sp. GAS493]|uniref:type II toxin-antitoxin system VapC family toxin n=1 Tax=Jatrophihabitans sp. GAS493 TaxID=1907575 RepID=UPI000BB740F5|nr:type II toxin-antitoxin system VapC family toxin [Jatrophihabitans sp. GAS493]SOD72260.1 predicted nucleic acid-binding protein [Jatrophihabitans sp. GAS493]
MIVVDASVLANAIGDDGPAGARARAVLVGQSLSIPDLADVEVASVLRRRWLRKDLTARRFREAIHDLAAVPADRYPASPFMPRAYELRANVTAYDATYVALAEELRCSLYTADGRLATVPGIRCAVSLLGK